MSTDQFILSFSCPNRPEIVAAVSRHLYESRHQVIGSKDVLQAVIAGKQNANVNVRGFVGKWRAVSDEDENYVYSIAL
jgi:hypothetical protein